MKRLFISFITATAN